jgi:aromatic-amino-acid transaminase
MYDHLPLYPGDPILSLHEAFQSDPHPNKASLSIGVYTDEGGRLPVLDSVRAASRRIEAEQRPSGYLPMEGAADYRAAVQALVFGAASPALAEGRIATIQTVGGSGALRIGADFIKAFFPTSSIWLSDPTWDNHEAIMRGAGLEVKRYPYYDAATNGLRWDDMLALWQSLPPKSIVLLQPCCHNPTGIDLTRDQWLLAIEVFKSRSLIPFVDMAYQGFGAGVEEDAWVIREMVTAGLFPLVANSFSKNFSLYGERCGGLSVVCPTAAEAKSVLGQLQAGVRRIYSSPPRHGAQLVAAVLGDDGLRTQWLGEVSKMRDRILRMRARLAALLGERLPGAPTGYLTDQHGMFSYTGLTPDEVVRLRDRHGVYLVLSGRMCVAGLNEANVGDVADAVAVVLAERGQ